MPYSLLMTMNTTARSAKSSSTRGSSASRPSRRRRRGSAQSDGRGRSGGGSGGRGRKSKGPLLGGLAALVALVIAAAVAVNWTTSSSSDAADGSASSSPSVPSPDPTPEPSGATESAEASGKPDEKAGGKADAEPSGKGSPSASSSSSAPKIPASGPGTFATAGGTSGTVGGKGGRVLSYKVVVEDGLTQSAADVAEQVEGILADPRGWTADGRSGFRRVSSGSADFVVRLATPGTVDAICGKYGLNTRGEVNCNVGKDVVVNLKRWLLATPVYAADVDAYRALIINHEVGHFLGHGHVMCPGAGKPAPAMMQQIKGMLGCKPNVWPYDANGRFVTGPAVS